LRLVLDASVLVAALVDAGPLGHWSEAAIVEADVILAPELILIEVTHVLRGLERRGDIDRRRASAAFLESMRLDLEFMPFAPFAARVWALRHNLTSYDATYVAVAEAFDATLATLDTRLVRAPGISCETLSP